MGWNAQPTAQVIFEGVRVPADAMLGGADGEGTGFGIAMNGLNGGRINIAACSLGGAQAAHDKARSYLADRQAFGGSLLDEPTIRFALADMATTLEASRTLLWRAASALDDEPSGEGRTVRDGQALRHRRLLRRGRSGAATARRLRVPARVRTWRRSSAICGCIESSRAPTKSCVWSSVGPKRPGPARRA